MSRVATDWAWSVTVKPATLKIILLSMADRADEDHCCFPSLARLVKDTSLDRKTVQSGIKRLESMGYISDTGERRGATQRVRVFRLALNDPENGNVPKNGTLNDPKNGTLNDPKIGTQNQSVEPVNEPVDAPDKSGPILLSTYLERCKAEGAKPLPPDCAVFRYQQDSGLPTKFLLLAWKEFKARNIDNKKKYRSWPLAYLNCIRDNWYGLWWVSDDGEYLLTSKGKQAEKLHGVVHD